MMKTRAITIGAAFALGLAACDNDSLTDLNQNPNSPEDVPATTLFTSATRASVGRWLGAYGYFQTELVAQHLAQVQYPDQDRYARLGAADTQGNFDNPYTNELEDFTKVIAKGKEANAAGTYAPAMIMRTWGFHYITNTFGDIPYFAALTGDQAEGADIAPKYDAQKEIYADFFKQLDQATKDLAANGSVGSLGGGDPIYGGNALKWQRFSNSLRARLAMQLVNVEPATTDKELRAAIAAPGGLFASNDDNARLNWPGDGIYNNPWADAFKTRDDYRVSKTLVDILNAYQDPRVAIFAMPTPANGAVYAGLQNALTPAQAGTFFNTTSRPGAFLFPGATAYGTIGGSGSKAPSFLMTYAETQFILAEVAERGIAGLAASAAKGYYEAGIRASMAQWSAVNAAAGLPAVSAAAIDAYLARPEVAYKGGVDGLKQIATQKWIHLYTDGGTSWSEWRRTCQPFTLKPGPAATQSTVPRRFFYSPTEYTSNRSSVDAAIAAQGADDFNSRMYWDKAPTAAPTYATGCGSR